ncbi:guanylate kinase [Afifella pfennigii]|uniref:guanylate kinase n=1 Tax=Afifella pfennigii TaxID=209897 RepID=UPI00068EDF8E|nr:guanylate kinase [Afifella pfennigii]
MNAEPIRLMRRGLMFVLSSPSGAGKSTLARQLLDADDGLELSISVTTRPRRPSEREGVHYHFIDEVHFKRMVERGDLLEWAEVHGNHYGTPVEPVEDALSAGRDVLFDIDWQGTAQIAEKLPDDLVRVFVLPPSMRELKARLERRAEDSRETIGRRLAGSLDEISQWSRYDYIIVNDDLERAFEAVRGILTAERLKRDRVLGLRAFVGQLLAEGGELIDELGGEETPRASSS